MKKSELEVALANKTMELNQFKDNVVKALMNVVDNTCEESREHVDNFCKELGLPKLEKFVLVKIPYGVEIEEMQDGDYDEIEFEVVDADFKQ